MKKDKPKFNPDLKVPFDYNRSMMPFTYNIYPAVDPVPINPSNHWELDGLGEWRDNAPFAATLRVSDFRRGRSAAHFIIKDDAGREYTMFAKFLLDALQNDTCFNGWLHGQWAFVKRGPNYSIIKL